jgi:outer membrane protein assembly factor BamD
MAAKEKRTLIHGNKRSTSSLFVRGVAAIGAVALIAGCAGSGAAVKEKSAQEWYDQGSGLVAKKKYDEALEAFREAGRGYRGADLDADIQLALADTYVSKEEYPSAVEAYGEFLRLHPHNARADYAQYRIGFSWQKQMRTADRSQEPARRALAAYDALLRGYPRSSWLAAATEGRAAARLRLAEHEMTVADFYRRTGSFRAAAGRYEFVLSEYADAGLADKALFELAGCYRQLREDDKAARAVEQLQREYPQSKFLHESKSTKS